MNELRKSFLDACVTLQGGTATRRVSLQVCRQGKSRPRSERPADPVGVRDQGEPRQARLSCAPDCRLTHAVFRGATRAVSRVTGGSSSLSGLYRSSFNGTASVADRAGPSTLRHSRGPPSGRRVRPRLRRAGAAPRRRRRPKGTPVPSTLPARTRPASPNPPTPGRRTHSGSANSVHAFTRTSSGGRLPTRLPECE
jgi:hypothetical protein